MGRFVAAAAVVLVAVASACASTAPPPYPTALSTRPDSAEEIAERAARLDPASYKPISPRDLALLVKDPDSHKGERVVIYGEVTQLDAATGTTEFRADIGAEPPNGANSYSENSYVSAASNPALLANVVEHDTLRMCVEVVGAYTYSTQMGGEATVPKFAVYVIETVSAGTP